MTPREKFDKIVDLVLCDNQMTKDDLPQIDAEGLRLLVQQAGKIPEDRVEDFAIGEVSKANAISYLCGVQGLSRWLDSLV